MSQISTHNMAADSRSRPSDRNSSNLLGPNQTLLQQYVREQFRQSRLAVESKKKNNTNTTQKKDGNKKNLTSDPDLQLELGSESGGESPKSSTAAHARLTPDSTANAKIIAIAITTASGNGNNASGSENGSANSRRRRVVAVAAASLATIPQEILSQIAKQLPTVLDVLALRKTSRRLYNSLSPYSSQYLYYHFLTLQNLPLEKIPRSRTSREYMWYRQMVENNPRRYGSYNGSVDYYSMVTDILSGRSNGCGICLEDFGPVGTGGEYRHSIFSGYRAYRGGIFYKKVCKRCAVRDFTELWQLEDTHPGLSFNVNDIITWDYGSPFDDLRLAAAHNPTVGVVIGRWRWRGDANRQMGCIRNSDLEAAIKNPQTPKFSLPLLTDIVTASTMVSSPPSSPPSLSSRSPSPSSPLPSTSPSPLSPNMSSGYYPPLLAYETSYCPSFPPYSNSSIPSPSPSSPPLAMDSIDTPSDSADPSASAAAVAADVAEAATIKTTYESRYDKQILFANQRKEGVSTTITILTKEYAANFQNLHWLKNPVRFQTYLYKTLLWELRPWLAPDFYTVAKVVENYKRLPKLVLAEGLERVLEVWMEGRELERGVREEAVRNSARQLLVDELLRSGPRCGTLLRPHQKILGRGSGKITGLVRYWVEEWLMKRGYKCMPQDGRKDHRNTPRVCPFCSREEGEEGRRGTRVGNTVGLVVHVWHRHPERMEDRWEWIPC
ncbi:hypothetical protein TWF730_008954 [Orbilia blumenaviensis]|uniref:F-box domain-containing protein n=1 Tax=Orbilia blumenaviensis TaxID=1796055 RepID=A0AAV9V0Y4_9PEZI